MAVYISNINTSNVKDIKQKWVVKTRSYITSQPLYYANKILVSDWQGYIYAFDSETGNLIYEYQLYQPPKTGNAIKKTPILKRFLSEPFPYIWNGFAGTGCVSNELWYLASVGGKEGGLFSNGAPGRLYAVYAQTGEVIWESALSDNKYSGSLAVPVCDDFTLYVGLCSVDEVASAVYKLALKKFEPQCVGEVFCFQKYSGKLLWNKKTTELIPKDNKKAKGASVWGGLSIVNRNNLLFATGNSYGRPASKACDSVICVNSLDGNLKWNFQAVENDSWLPLKPEGPDFDFGCTPLPFSCAKASSGIGIAAGNKNGYVYALDLGNGELLWKTYCHILSKPEDGIRSNITYDNGRIYVWSKNKSPKETMSISCLDAETGEFIWNVIAKGTNAMTTGAVTNDLFILSNYSGELYALDTATGEKTWSSFIKKASFGSDIAIYNNKIYTGMGVPALYGGSTKMCGVACYGFE